MKLEVRAEISTHADFKNEKPKIEHFLNSKGFCCIFYKVLQVALRLRLLSRKWKQYTLPTEGLALMNNAHIHIILRFLFCMLGTMPNVGNYAKIMCPKFVTVPLFIKILKCLVFIV